MHPPPSSGDNVAVPTTDTLANVTMMIVFEVDCDTSNPSALRVFAKAAAASVGAFPVCALPPPPRPSWVAQPVMRRQQMIDPNFFIMVPTPVLCLFVAEAWWLLLIRSHHAADMK